jgi:CheY-like chemotaxis protein
MLGYKTRGGGQWPPRCTRLSAKHVGCDSDGLQHAGDGRLRGHGSAIRTLEKVSARRVPIVAMTANTQAADVAKCLSAGMDDHLSKPLTLDQSARPFAALAAGAGAGGARCLWWWCPGEPAGGVVDAVALMRLREALGGTIGQAIRAFSGRHAALPGRPGRRRRVGARRFALHRACHQGCCGQFGCSGADRGGA